MQKHEPWVFFTIIIIVLLVLVCILAGLSFEKVEHTQDGIKQKLAMNLDGLYDAAFEAGKQYALSESQMDVVGKEIRIVLDGELYIHTIE